MGDGWLAKSGVTPERIARWEERQSEERKRRDGTVIPGRLIYYADLTDVPTILKKNWSHFTECLGDWKTMEVYLERLSAYRIAIMHGRSLLPFESHLVEGITGELRNRVTVWMSNREHEPELFARIEHVTDSFGNRASGDSRAVDTGLTLHPGDRVVFRMVAWDPLGAAVTWSALKSMAGRIGEPTTVDELVWNVERSDIRDPCEIVIYCTGSTDYHRRGSFDDAVSFLYRVLPSR